MVPADGSSERAAGGKGVRIDVEDDGPGISEQVRARLFEPSSQHKGRGQGNGSRASGLPGPGGGGRRQHLARPRHQKGARFVVELPAMKPA